MKTPVSPLRITPCNDAPVNRDGDCVLYWMTAFRRIGWNFALDRAVEWALTLDKPILVFEPLRCDYPWASDRFHSFIIEGMVDNARDLAGGPAAYYPFVEKSRGEGKGLLETLAADACVVVTDDFPCFFIPNMIKASAEKVAVLMEKVDSNGILPLRLSDKAFQTAYHFRRFCQQNLLEFLERRPRNNPFKGMGLKSLKTVPESVAKKWPPFNPPEKEAVREVVRSLPVDHSVKPVKHTGGIHTARTVLSSFLENTLSVYKDDRNHPDAHAESGLSPYLHFGHISSHEVVDDVLRRQAWFPQRFSGQATGQREGWWGLEPDSEAFLDQIITWRELGFQFCHKQSNYNKMDSIPGWALKTLREHEADPRPYLYSEKELDEARTHDPVWNAAQNQLREEGVIHNYMRMLWGKLILQWSPTPGEALRIMTEFNNRYALDGRDPNSYTGVFWILGRHDRAWGPERPVFGKVRYMTSESARKKLRMKEYLRKWGG